MSISRTPSGRRASSTALTTAGGEPTVADEYSAGIDGHPVGGEAGSGNVVRPYDGAYCKPCQVGGNHSRGMGVNDSPDVWAAPEELGVQRQFVGDRVPVRELAVGGGIAVEVHHADVFGLRVRQSAFVRAATAHQQCAVGNFQADVTQDSICKAPMGQDPAGEGDTFPGDALGLGQQVPGCHDALLAGGSNWGSSLARRSCTVMPLAMPRRQAMRALGQFTMAAPRTVVPSMV